ncbi:hypothetical protein IJG91_02155 [Candidatus Saccharibacteria bacterium]|nr:hypothetical protein [Candidatus Saccharibacteria bacterium]
MSGIDRMESYRLFKDLVTGRRISITAAEKFKADLIRTGRDIVKDMPRLSYDFMIANSGGDDLILSFALIYSYINIGKTEAGLVIYGSKNRYAVTYKDNSKYPRFSMPYQAIESGMSGPYISMSRGGFIEEIKNEGVMKGEVYYLSPNGEYENERFYSDKLIFDTKFSL